MMDSRYQVKQFIGVIQGRWCRFMAFTTGDPRWWLLCQLDRYGCQTTLQVPVRRQELKKPIPWVVL